MEQDYFRTQSKVVKRLSTPSLRGFHRSPQPRHFVLCSTARDPSFCILELSVLGCKSNLAEVQCGACEPGALLLTMHSA